jgi:hypothetical protein
MTLATPAAAVGGRVRDHIVDTLPAGPERAFA